MRLKLPLFPSFKATTPAASPQQESPGARRSAAAATAAGVTPLRLLPAELRASSESLAAAIVSPRQTVEW